MTRKIKEGALIVLAAMALLAAAAAPAAGVYFHSEATHTIWSGVQTGEDRITLKAGTVGCGNITYAGTTSTATSTTISLAPTFSECKAFGFVNASVHPNGCEYRYHTEKEGSSSQGLSIVCPEGKAIVVTAFNCDVSIPAQSSPFTINYSTTGASSTRDIDITWSIPGLKYTQTSTSFPGCTNGSFSDGKYAGATTLKGANTEGAQVGGWTTSVHEAETEHAVETAHEIETGLATEIHSEATHTIWSGVQTGEDRITLKAGTVGCGNITYAGTTSTATSTTISLAPTFSECKAFGFVNASVHPNGCEYRYHTEKEGSSSQGLSIVCPEGKAIVVTAFNCHVSIPAQSGLTTVNYSNTGGDIDIAWQIEGLEYSQESKSFPGCTNGTFTSGTSTGATTLKAANTEGAQAGAWVTKPKMTEAEHIDGTEEHFHETETQPRADLHSETAHTIWSGGQSGEDKFTFNVGTAGCNEIGYAGTTSAITVTTLSLIPSFLECRLSGLGYFPIDVNGCEFRYHTQKEGVSSQGMSIACPAGQAIVITGSHCRVTIPAQVGLTTVSYLSTGVGSARDIDLGWSVSGLKYSQESKSFPGCTNGIFTNGTYGGRTTLKGFGTEGKQVGVWAV